MRRSVTTVLASLGAATVLVLAANTVSVAATGQGFLLGKSNSAGTVTGLTRTTDGSVLKLTTKSSVSAPLAVNGTGKVTNLHADKVDGLDGSRLQNAVWEYALPAKEGNATPVVFSFPGLPGGRYLASYSVVADVTDGGLLCGFLFNSNQESGLAIGGVNNSYSAPAATGVVDSRTGPVVLRCLTPNGTWSMVPPDGRVSFTRIDTVTTGTATAP